MTEKQKTFADEYFIDLNVTQAYRVAYPSVKKDETAAARMLRKVKEGLLMSLLSQGILQMVK